MKKQTSIRSRLSSLVAISFFITIATLITYVTISTRQIAIQNAKDNITSQANEYALHIKNRFETALNASRTMSYVLKTVDEQQNALQMSRQSLLLLTQNVLTQYDWFLGTWTYWEPNAFDGKDSEYKFLLSCNEAGRTHSYFVRDLTGKISGQNSLSSTENDTSEWYRIPKSEKREHITTPYTWPINGKNVLMISVEVPIMNDTTFLGVSGNDISIDWLQNYISIDTLNKQNAEISIFSPTGIIAAHTGKTEWLGKHVSECLENYDEILKSLKKGVKEIYVNDNQLFVIVPIEIGKIEAKWQIRMKVPMEQITVAANRMMWTQIVIAIILLFSSVLMVIFFINRLIKPIHITKNMLDRIANGDLPQTIQEKYIGEFDSMKNSMNRVIEANREIIQKIKQFANGDNDILFEKRSENDELILAFNSLVETNRSIVDAARKVASGDLTVSLKKRSHKDDMIEALTSMVNEINKIIEHVSLSSQNMTTASNQLNSVAQQVSSGASQQAASTEEVSASLEQMSAGINQNSDNAKEAQQIAKKVSANVSTVISAVAETKEAMQNIVDRIKVINEIAEKTDLLAINAAIEAARAGQFGKGFSVVASEVRQLAVDSSKAAKQIQMVSSESLLKAENSNNLLKSTAPDIQKTTQLVEEIASASIEQNHGILQVNQALFQLSNVVQQNSAVSEEMASSAEELAGQSRHLQNMISFFRTSNVLKKEQPIRALQGNIMKMQQELADLIDFKDDTIQVKNEPVNKKITGVQINMADNMDGDFESF